MRSPGSLSPHPASTGAVDVRHVVDLCDCVDELINQMPAPSSPALTACIEQYQILRDGIAEEVSP